MKFSVLIPTRNRLEFLVQAVESVRRQDFDDWEVIVADNHSDEDVAGYVRSIGDARVKYGRSTELLPVTDNWNLALERSSGEYVLMLGDDDFVLPGYFRVLSSVADAWGTPDGIYTGAFLFTHPGVTNEGEPGVLQTYSYADFLQTPSGSQEPRELGQAERHSLVRDFFQFRVRYGFNMQFAVVSRRYIDSAKPLGPFYQSEFPDYFAMNILMLRADRVVAFPRPMVVIGVTPKSYGFFHGRRREAEGRAFLEGRPSSTKIALPEGFLPGSNINNGWLSALRQIQGVPGLGTEFYIDYRRYRWLQILSLVESRFVYESAVDDDLRDLRRRLGRPERWCLDWLSMIRFAPPRVRRRAIALLRRRLRQTPPFAPETIVGDFKTALDVLDRFDPGRA